MIEPTAPVLGDAVSALLAEAETANTEIARLRSALDAAVLRRQELFTAVDAAAAALPHHAQEEIAYRVQRLAEAMTPKRGRTPDTMQLAVVAYLAERAQDTETEIVRVAEVQIRLERMGLKPRRGYASNCMARLAEQGFAVKLAYARYRINGLHPEIVALRFRLLERMVAEQDARDRELAEAERRGRDRKWGSYLSRR